MYDAAYTLSLHIVAPRPRNTVIAPSWDTLVFSALTIDMPVCCCLIMRYSAGHPTNEDDVPATMAMPIVSALVSFPFGRIGLTTPWIALFTPNCVAMMGPMAPQFTHTPR